MIDAWSAGALGYCRFLKFKCAAARTCDAWVVGGPLTDDKTTPANKDAGTSHATTLIINPKGRSIVPEGIINEALNTEQQELYLDFLKDLSWYFKIQPNPDMSTYNPEKVLGDGVVLET